MLDALVFVLIFVGVIVSMYQLYAAHYDLNFEDEEGKSRPGEEELQALSQQAKAYATTGDASGFVQKVKEIFGEEADHRLVLAAFSTDNERTYAAPLLRRKEKLVFEGDVKARHLPFWKTGLPSRDMRGILLTGMVANCLLALFWGAMSVYTLAYEVTLDSLAWLNSEFVLMLLIYLSVIVTHGLSRLDSYTHDLYEIGRLGRIAHSTDTHKPRYE